MLYLIAVQLIVIAVLFIYLYKTWRNYCATDAKLSWYIWRVKRAPYWVEKDFFKG